MVLVVGVLVNEFRQITLKILSITILLHPLKMILILSPKVRKIDDIIDNFYSPFNSKVEDVSKNAKRKLVKEF